MKYRELEKLMERYSAEYEAFRACPDGETTFTVAEMIELMERYGVQDIRALVTVMFLHIRNVQAEADMAALVIEEMSESLEIPLEKRS